MTLNLQRVFTLTQKCLPLLRAAADEGKVGNEIVDPARIINVGTLFISQCLCLTHLIDWFRRGIERSLTRDIRILCLQSSAASSKP
jgi:hypothetical protein